MKRITAAVVGAIAPASILAFAPGLQRSGFDHFTASKEIVVLALVGAAAALVVSARRALRLQVIDVVLLTVFGLGMIGTLTVAVDPDTAWRAVAMSGAAIALFWVARTAPPQLVLRSVAVACAIAAVGVIGEAFDLWSLSLAGRTPGGTEGHRNFMAHALAIGLPAVVATALEMGRPRRRMLGLAAVAAVVMAITLSRSRTAWVAAAVGTCVMVFAAYRGWRSIDRRRVAVIGAAFLVGATAAITLPNQLSWWSSSPYADTALTLAAFDRGSGRGRVLQYAATARMVIANPVLGVGPGQWSIAYPEFSQAPDANYSPLGIEPVSKVPNADWLPFAAERGVPAFVLLLVAAALAIRSCVVAMRREGGRVPAVVGLAAIATTAVAGTFDAVLSRPTPLVILALLVGAGMARTEAAARRGLSGLAHWPAAAAIVALSFIAMIRPARALGAMYRYESPDLADRIAAGHANPSAYEVNMTVALELTKRRDCELARAHAREVLEHYPHHMLARRVIDRCEAVARGTRDRT